MGWAGSSIGNVVQLVGSCILGWGIGRLFIRRTRLVAVGKRFRGRPLPLGAVHLFVGLVFVAQTALQPPATAGDLRRVERGLLQLRHPHGNRGHLHQMRVAAHRAAAIAVVGQQFRFIAHADLPHLDPRLELAGQQSDQLAKIDPAFGQIVDHDPFAAEDMFGVDQLHLQAEPFDVLLADLDFVSGLLLHALQLMVVFGSHLAEDLAGTGVFHAAKDFGRDLAQNIADLQAAVGPRDHLHAPAALPTTGGREDPQEPHRTVSNYVVWHG